MNQVLKIALPKGRLAKETMELFNTIDIPQVVDFKSRKLVFKDESNNIEYILAKPSDIITYIEQGICDLGIVGKDSIDEVNPDIYELLDLNIGKCKMCIAGFNKEVLNKQQLTVASKYPNTAINYFKKTNKRINMIKLNGSVELGPVIQLSDIIVDIVETGSTLKANNLKVLEEISDISARLISNKASYRIKQSQIDSILKRIIEMRS